MNETDIVEISLEQAGEEDEVLVLPAYTPTIEETFKASGGHRQFF